MVADGRLKPPRQPKTKAAPKKAAEVDKDARHAEICQMVADGKTVRQIAEHFGVSAGSILAWATETEKFTEQYARAREAAADTFETEIIETALAVTPETAASDRVKIDAMKWVAARRAPKKYGDRLTQEISGPGGKPIQHEAVDLSKLSDAALAELMAARPAKG
jgi:transposase-like protein